MSSQEIQKVILNSSTTGEFFVFSVGDEKEMAVYYDYNLRKCFIKNVSSSKLAITFSIKKQNDVDSKIITLNMNELSYLDDYPINTFGKSSIIQDCTFTSTSNIYGFDYNHECVSQSTYGQDSNYNRILAAIAVVAKLA